VTYYFVVSAVIGGQEGTTSEQVEIHPFDTTQTVLTVGKMSEGGQFTPYLEASSSAVQAGQPGFICAEHFTGLLNLRELCYYGYGNLMNQFIGTKGYQIYNWGGAGSSLSTIVAPNTVTAGSGWSDISYLSRQFRTDNVLGTSHGLTATPLGAINITVTDTNYHYLTVVSPAQFNTGRKFALRLTAADSTSATYNINESYGSSDTYQFLFKGNVTLYADATGGGSYANVQAVFLDDAPVTYAAVQTVPAVLTPPTQFRIGH